MAQLLPNVVQQFRDSNGVPLAGGKLYSYQAGTSTPLATYTDQGAGTPNANPTILDGAGMASVWLSSAGYKLKLTDSLGNVQWTVDNVYIIAPSSIGALEIQNGSITPVELNLATLTPSDLPANCIDTLQLKSNSVTQAKIPDGEIPFEKLDPTMDLTRFGNVIELAWGNRFFQNKPLPQYPWNSPILLSNPGTLPAGACHGCQWSPDGRFLAVVHSTSPYVTIYEKCGTKLTKLSDPDTLPSGTCYGVSWSPSGDMLAVVSDSAPTLVVYRRYGSNFVKLPSVATLPAGNAVGVSWSPNEDFLATVHQSSPWMTVYQVFRKSVALETGSVKYYEFTVTPGTAYTGDVYSIGGATVYTVFASTNGTKLIAASNSTPAASGTLTLVTGNGSGTITYSAVRQIDIDIETIYFSKLADPATLPGTALFGGKNPTGVCWSPENRYLAISSENSPFLFIYERSGTTLTLVSDTAGLASTTETVAISADGTFLVVGQAVSPYVKIYQFSGGSCSVVSNPASLPAGEVVSAAWSPNGLYLALAHWTSPRIIVYQRSGTTFTKLTDPVDLPPGNGYGVSFSPDNQFLAHVADTTSYLSTYQTASTLPSKGILYMRG
jgi:WD40 repeat protein